MTDRRRRSMPCPVESWPAASDAAGPATIEAYTVMHSRDGEPETAIAACLLADGRRAWGTSTERGIGDGDVRRRVGRPHRDPRQRRERSLADRLALQRVADADRRQVGTVRSEIGIGSRC